MQQQSQSARYRSFKQQIQEAKIEVFTVLKENNNIPMTLKQIENKLSLKGISFDVELSVVVMDYQPLDEFQIIADNSTSAQYKKYKIKTPDVNDLDSLEQFFKDQNGSYIGDKAVFESSYGKMQNDLISLVHEDLLITAQGKNKGDPHCMYLLMDQVFKNQMESTDFKGWFDKKYKEIVVESNTDIRQKRTDAESNKLPKESKNRRTNLINFWIPDLEKMLKQ